MNNDFQWFDTINKAKRPNQLVKWSLIGTKFFNVFSSSNFLAEAPLLCLPRFARWVWVEHSKLTFH